MCWRGIVDRILRLLIINVSSNNLGNEKPAIGRVIQQLSLLRVVLSCWSPNLSMDCHPEREANAASQLLMIVTGFQSQQLSYLQVHSVTWVCLLIHACMHALRENWLSASFTTIVLLCMYVHRSCSAARWPIVRCAVLPMSSLKIAPLNSWRRDVSGWSGKSARMWSKCCFVAFLPSSASLSTPKNRRVSFKEAWGQQQFTEQEYLGMDGNLFQPQSR